MNDFVRNVVEEVIKGASKESSQLNRPNYQREASRKRLKVYDLPPIEPFSFEQPKEKVSGSYTPYIDEYSSIRRLTLSHSIPAKAPQTDAGGKTYEICKTAATIALRYIDKVDSRIISMTGIQCREGSSLGLACCEECRISQLFAVDEVLAKFPDIDGIVSWSLESATRFIFRMTGSSSSVKQALAALRERLSPESMKNNGVLLSASPSVLLQRQLKITSNRPAAAIEGINYIDAISLINSYYLGNRESVVDFTAGSNFVLAQGDISEITSALQDFLRELENLNEVSTI